MPVRKVRPIPILLTFSTVLVLVGWAFSDTLRYRQIVGVRSAIRHDVQSDFDSREVYSWEEPAAQVAARTASVLTPDQGWTQDGSLDDPHRGLAFSRSRPPSFLSRVRSLFGRPSEDRRETVILWAAQARPREEDEPFRIKSGGKTPWTTVSIRMNDAPPELCGVGLAPNWGLQMTMTPSQRP